MFGCWFELIYHAGIVMSMLIAGDVPMIDCI